MLSLLGTVRRPDPAETPLPGVYRDNGTFAGSGPRLDVHDPSTGQIFAGIAPGGDDDVSATVRSASRAAPGWAALSPAVRARALYLCGQAILDAADDLTDVDVRDAGLPLSLARRDVEVAARYFQYYAGLADKLHGEAIPLGPGFVDYTVREPWGVCAVILPFNFPLQLAARDIAAALAAGNSVVAKPAEQAPLAPLALVEICWQSGLPPGVLNALVGDGAIGDRLVRHPDVAHVTFTGSQATGRRVMSACADTIKASTIELGGKSPHLLFEDGVIDDVVEAIVNTTFRTAGQACSAGTRLIVHDKAHQPVVEQLADAVRRLRVGPADTDPDVGPLISARQQEAVLEAVDAAVAGGARLVTGDSEGHQGGYFVPPTVLDSVSAAAGAAQAEIFGPVLSVLSFSEDEEAIALANGTEFGLVAGVWTRDVGRAHRVAARVQAGQVFINNYGVGGGVELPFGGYKRSGIGRVKGAVALAEYTQLKNVCVAL